MKWDVIAWAGSGHSPEGSCGLGNIIIPNGEQSDKWRTRLGVHPQRRSALIRPSRRFENTACGRP